MFSSRASALPQQGSSELIREIGSDGFSSAASPPAELQPPAGAMPGDDETPNNFIPLSDANCLHCAPSVTCASVAPDGSSHQQAILPDEVKITIFKDETGPPIYHCDILVTNPYSDRTARILVGFPKLSGMVLLEEHHQANGIEFLPTVEEAAAAQEKFDEAISNSHATASLSTTTDETISLSLDKLRAGEKAHFTIKLVQSKLAEQQKVNAAASEPTKNIADFVIVPGWTPAAFKAVRFSLDVIYSSEYILEAVPNEVISEDLKQLNDKQHGQPLVGSYLHFGPSSVTDLGPLQHVAFKTNGFGQSTIIKLRLARQVAHADLVNEMGNIELAAPALTASVSHTVPSVFHDPLKGTPFSLSKVEFEIPAKVPLKASGAAHEIHVVVDTSGSTGMRHGDETFLDKVKTMLCAILRVLPQHVAVLQAADAIDGQQPVTCSLWHFNSDVHELGTVDLIGGDIEQLCQKVAILNSSGMTNYDNWSTLLENKVRKAPNANHSVLLVTDGGATHLERFAASIQSAQKYARSLQVDCLGYGPWLNANTVQMVTKLTGGEAVMVERPEDDVGTKRRVLSLLARSLLRGAGKFNLDVHSVVLCASGSGAKELTGALAWSSDSLLRNNKPFRMPVRAGEKLSMELLHPAGAVPVLQLSTGDDQPPVDVCLVVNDTAPVVHSHPAFRKLASGETNKCLSHLMVLEPAYCTTEQVHPECCEDISKLVRLSLSLRGQVVAPSVTKAVCVAQLEQEITPVPEHCVPASFKWSEAYLFLQASPADRNLLGSNRGSGAQSQAGGGGLFGGAAACGGGFGQATRGGGGTFGAVATPACGGGFGAAATSACAGGFGAATSACAGGFGQAAPAPARGGGMFGGANSTNTAAAAVRGGGLFGAPAAAAAAVRGGGLFGAPPPAAAAVRGGGLFGGATEGATIEQPGGLHHWLTVTHGGLFPAIVQTTQTKGELQPVRLETLELALKDLTDKASAAASPAGVGVLAVVDQISAQATIWTAQGDIYEQDHAKLAEKLLACARPLGFNNVGELADVIQQLVGWARKFNAHWFCDGCNDNSMQVACVRTRCVCCVDFDLCTQCLLRGQSTHLSQTGHALMPLRLCYH